MYVITEEASQCLARARSRRRAHARWHAAPSGCGAYSWSASAVWLTRKKSRSLILLITRMHFTARWRCWLNALLKEEGSCGSAWGFSRRRRFSGQPKASKQAPSSDAFPFSFFAWWKETPHQSDWERFRLGLFKMDLQDFLTDPAPMLYTQSYY